MEIKSVEFYDHTIKIYANNKIIIGRYGVPRYNNGECFCPSCAIVFKDAKLERCPCCGKLLRHKPRKSGRKKNVRLEVK